jgi:hypothetical protein
METNYPLSAKRLYALIGDRISEFPPYFIERLEHRLEESALLRARSACCDSVVSLRRSPDVASEAGRRRQGEVGVPLHSLHALGSILETLHAVHVARPEAHPVAGITAQMVEGLIVCGREIVKASIAETGGTP